MKIYFTEGRPPFVAEYANKEDEPVEATSFNLKKGQSTFAPRYEVADGKLADKYPDLKDEEVAVLLQEEEKAKAEKIAAEHAAAQAKAKAAE